MGGESDSKYSQDTFSSITLLSQTTFTHTLFKIVSNKNLDKTHPPNQIKSSFICRSLNFSSFSNIDTIN